MGRPGLLYRCARLHYTFVQSVTSVQASTCTTVHLYLVDICTYIASIHVQAYTKKRVHLYSTANLVPYICTPIQVYT